MRLCRDNLGNLNLTIQEWSPTDFPQKFIGILIEMINSMAFTSSSLFFSVIYSSVSILDQCVLPQSPCWKIQKHHPKGYYDFSHNASSFFKKLYILFFKLAQLKKNIF